MTDAPQTFAGLPRRAEDPLRASGDIGLYVTRELLESVPEERRPEYAQAVEEFAARKYQLGVEVARQLPGLMSGADPEAAARYLDAVRAVAEADWRAAVQAAKYLHHLQSAADDAVAEGYRRIIIEAVTLQPEGGAADAAAEELIALDRDLKGVEARFARADALRVELNRRRGRSDRRQDQAVRLAAALPDALAGVAPSHRPALAAQVRAVAQADAEAALGATGTLRELLGHRLSAAGAAEWVARGLEVLERNVEVGRGYFRLATKQSLQALDELRDGVPLRQVARVLKLYATALSGRDVAIRTREEMESVTPYGAEYIVLPPEMRFFDDDESNFIAYKVATAHGAGRIEFGTYDFRLESIPDVVAGLRRRYARDEEWPP
jgi:hypothetical protein